MVEHADEGEVLVCHRSLHMVQEKDEPWLRENIFHTRCAYEGRVCNVIIDGRSCTNLVVTPHLPLSI